MPTTSARKKITVDIPQSLYKRTAEVLQERHISTSELVREAMEQYLDAIWQKKLADQLAEGYIANAELDRQICEEFAFADAEQP
jgi:metal-responsive CopG/Arc/MetJ family transcriptional regulator